MSKARIGVGASAGNSARLEQLRAGDASACEAWVRAQSPRLLAVARRILRCEEDAQDAVQDAFIAAFRALAEFNGESALSTWLHRIAVNAALMRLRSRRRRREDPIDELLPRFESDGHHADPVASWLPLPDEELETEQTRVRVRACIDLLPESHRTVLVLRDLEGMDTAEAAAALGLSSDALKMRLHRARQALRKLLEPHFAAAPAQAVEKGSAELGPAANEVSVRDAA